MRTAQYANIVLTAAALLIPCWDQYQEKMIARAVAQQKVTIARMETPTSVISEQSVQATTRATRADRRRFFRPG
jgi:hypothetical protein